jgi:hypothetical protein
LTGVAESPRDAERPDEALSHDGVFPSLFELQIAGGANGIALLTGTPTVRSPARPPIRRTTSGSRGALPTTAGEAHHALLSRLLLVVGLAVLVALVLF